MNKEIHLNIKEFFVNSFFQIIIGYIITYKFNNIIYSIYRLITPQTFGVLPLRKENTFAKEKPPDYCFNNKIKKNSVGYYYCPTEKEIKKIRMVDEELNSTRSVSLSRRSQLTTLLLYAIYKKLSTKIKKKITGVLFLGQVLLPRNVVIFQVKRSLL